MVSASRGFVISISLSSASVDPFARQSGVQPTVGQAVIQFVSREMPFNSGPRNCGQAPANTGESNPAKGKIGRLIAVKREGPRAPHGSRCRRCSDAPWR